MGYLILRLDHRWHNHTQAPRAQQSEFLMLLSSHPTHFKTTFAKTRKTGSQRKTDLVLLEKRYMLPIGRLRIESMSTNQLD